MSLSTLLALGLLSSTIGCTEFDDDADDASYLRSATVLDQTTGQQCRKRAPWWTRLDCFSYDLTLNRDGTFFDSNDWDGTFDELDDGSLVLDFGEQGIVTLEPTQQNDRCWATDPAAPLGLAGTISVCVVPQPFLRVRNYFDPLANFTWIYPTASEAGHWAAAALTPPVDMQLRGVVYRLYSDSLPIFSSVWPRCWAGVPHRVQVFMSEGPAPDATPEVIEEFLVDLDDAAIKTFTPTEIELTLTTPLVVQAGTRVYVSVEMIRDTSYLAPLMSCVVTSKELNLPDTNYWSNAPTPPYPWPTLESFFRPSSTTHNYSYDLLGIPLDPVTPGQGQGQGQGQP